MSDDPIDYAVFSDLQEATGADFVAELVAAFFDEAPGILADLKDAASVGDPDRFRRAAHSIKSNAQVFGAHALAEMARGLEIAGIAKDAEAGRAALAALDAVHDRTAMALKDLLDG
ncbi:MAG: Hpt domain-containing protein [Cypionkella sp.]